MNSSLTSELVRRLLMKRRACDGTVRVDYPAFQEYHANRNGFLKKLGIGAVVLAAAGCGDPQMIGGDPLPALGGIELVPSQPADTNVAPTVIEVPPEEPAGGPMFEPAETNVAPKTIEVPREELMGDIAIPGDVNW
jgi:hypothetical protein